MSTLTAADFFLFRTPLLPSETLHEWGAGLESSRALEDGADLEAATRRDVDLARTRLREIVARPDVRAAIAVASPSLTKRIDPWLAGGDDEATRSVEAALVRYLVRMSGRATPFGLFAGCASGRGAAESTLCVPSRETYTRRSRVSLDWILALALRLVEDPAVRQQLGYRLNTSLYKIGARWRYYAIRLDDGQIGKNARSFPLRDFVTTPYAEAAFDRARAGDGASIRELAEAIVASFEQVSLADAERYVDDLVKAQLFWPTLLPAVTGGDPLTRLAEAVAEVPAAAETAKLLRSMIDDLRAADAAGPSVTTEAAARIVETAARVAPAGDSINLVRVDLCKPGEALTLKTEVMAEIARGTELLYKLTAPRESPIPEFTGKFLDRYQGREVPLLEALDPEFGIGFEHPAGADQSPLIKGLPFQAPQGSASAWSERDTLLLSKLVDAAAAGQTSIDLSEEDVKVLTWQTAPLPPGQTATVSIIADSAQALDSGDYRIFLRSAAYTTASALLGRFLQNHDELLDGTRRFIQQEDAQRPDVVHAEVAHHNEGYGTNLACRPFLRDFEIDLLGGSGAPAERRIPLSDLLVSVREGEVILRSASLGRRVIPHLSNAHNFDTKGFAAYRLLGCLQRAYLHADPHWTWGRFAGARFLPRLTSGRFVLALAMWLADADRWAACHALSGAERFRAVAALRAELKLPRHVSLMDKDNILPLDLDNPLCVESLLQLCKGREQIRFVENLSAGPGAARGTEGTFQHEILVPLLRTGEAPRTSAPLAAVRRAAPSTLHVKQPGSDWLFVKLYSGMANRDTLLSATVAPLARRLREEGLIGRWFFLRYGDPDLHLRIRFQGDPAVLWSSVAPRLFSALSSCPLLVHRVAIDAYDPEVERYGGESAMALAHEIFAADSEATGDLVRIYGADQEARWRLALYGMHDLLATLGFDVAARREIASAARDHWQRSTRADASMPHRLGERFRAVRRELEQFLNDSPPTKYARGLDILRRRAAALAHVGGQLRELERVGELEVPLNQLAQHYLHMSANRIFRGSQNAYELVLYDFLARLYDSALARTRKAGAPGRAAGKAG